MAIPEVKPDIFAEYIQIFPILFVFILISACNEIYMKQQLGYIGLIVIKIKFTQCFFRSPSIKFNRNSSGNCVLKTSGLWMNKIRIHKFYTAFSVLVRFKSMHKIYS
jgi:hypothetical protein